jgi:hypothetical protein
VDASALGIKKKLEHCFTIANNWELKKIGNKKIGNKNKTIKNKNKK